MPVRLRSIRSAPVLLLAAACGDDPVAPPPAEPQRTVLAYRQDTGETVLLNSDGSDAGVYAPGDTGLLPLGASAAAQALVLLDGTAIVIGTLGQAGLDTILQPAPQSLSLATISDNERLVALVSYAPDPGLIVFDRATRTADTLDYGPVDPVLPPVLAPGDGRVVLFGLTPTSFTVTVLDRDDPSRMVTRALRMSRFVDRPIFGWPRWVDDGIHLAFVRVANDGPDTLVVARLSPDVLDAPPEEQYRAVMAPVDDGQPELELGEPSTYALAPDARALVLGAFPAPGAARHSIYLVTPSVARVQPVRDEPLQFLMLPLFVRR
jgi:hypothetical protein